MEIERHWSPLVWILPAAVGIFFWPTVLILLYHQVISGFLSDKSLIQLVFLWVFGVPFTLFAISLGMLILYLPGVFIVGIAGKWKVTRGLVTAGSVVGGLVVATFCVVTLVHAFSNPGGSQEVSKTPMPPPTLAPVPATPDVSFTPGPTDQAALASDVDAYIERSKILNPATHALQNWTEIVNEHALLDSSKLDRPKVMQMIQAQLKAATNVYTATRDSLTDFRLIIPPPQCQETHLIMTEALQLQEQAFLEMKTYLDLAKSGGNVDERLQKANRLMAEADRVKQGGLFALKSCFGP